MVGSLVCLSFSQGMYFYLEHTKGASNTRKL